MAEPHNTDTSLRSVHDWPWLPAPPALILLVGEDVSVQGKYTQQNILGHDVSHRAINQPNQRHPCWQTGQIELINSSPGRIKNSKIRKLFTKVCQRLPGQEVMYLCGVTDIRPLAELQFGCHR
ncbi:hypothetical protein D9M71_818730 [compost metagenome]